MASVRVAVRVRPLDKREKQLSSKVIIHLMGNTIFINKPLPATGDEVVDRRKAFSYDYSYDSTKRGSTTYASQEKIFQDLGLDVLKAAFEGFNACVFAYGQTGSGKSYTMMGDINDKGITPRICEGLLSEMDRRSKSDGVSFCTEVSYMEIYNELVQDLLKDKTLIDDGEGLKVREHPVDGPYVDNLSKHSVHNHSEMEDLITLGNTNRMTASTGMNKSSSRSHAIFTIGFKQAWFDADLPRETLSRIHLVDLAGSERVDATRATGTRLKEGANINKSLVTLGSVISALACVVIAGKDTHTPSALRALVKTMQNSGCKGAFDPFNKHSTAWPSCTKGHKEQEADSCSTADLSVGGQSTKKKKQVFIPYRDSVLTWLLKDSLGGNSVTTMIATISPADVNYNETLSTLRYASRAKNIMNSPIVNEDGSVKVIRELQAEVTRLRGLLAEANQVSCEEPSSSVKVEEELHQNEEKAPTLTDEWTSKWGETRSILQEETVALRREGNGVVLDCHLPHLIGTDQLGTRIVLYYLKEGQTLIGSDAALCSLGIVLHGPGLLAEHCVLENLAGVVTLFPRDGAPCSVNGSVVTGPWQLTQGSVTQLGTGTVLLFSHPTEAAQLRDKQKNGLLSAFLLSLTDVSKSTESPSGAMLQNPSQTDVLAVETEESKVSAKTPVTAAATPGNHPNPHSCFEPEEDILPGGVSTRDGQEQEGDLCHQSGPELMSKWPRKAQSGAEVASYKEEEVRSGDASLQETSVLGPGDGCGTKPEGNTNKIQDVTADCCKGRPGSGGSSLSHASHLQSSAGTSAASVLPQTSRDSQPDQKHPTSQAAYCPPEKTSFKDPSGCAATNESGGSKEISEVCATDAAAAAAVVQSSALGSLVSKVSWVVQDAGRLFWSPATVLQQVRKKGIQPVRACWSSYFFSLVEGSKAVSVVKNSQVFSRVKGTLASSLFRDGSILSVLKDLPLIQQINTMIVQNLQLEEAAQMVEDIKQLQGLTSTQTVCKADKLPVQPVEVQQDVCTKNSGHQWFSQEQDITHLHVKQGGKLSMRQLQKATPEGNDQRSEILGALRNKTDVLFSRQTLTKFPPTLLKLQTLPLPDLMNTLQSSVSTLAEKILALSWLSVAKCSHPKPRPALLVLAESGLYTLTADSGSLLLFHQLPLSQLKEVHISLAGLGLCLMGATLESILGVYTHSQALTKELCCAILGVLHPEDGRVFPHPLLHGDLMKMSLDCESHVPDLLLDAGLRICSQFEKSLADLVYLLHRGMDEDEVSQGQAHILLYTTVGVCPSLSDDAEDGVAQFFLTDTHLGLVQEDVVFYPAPCSSPISPGHPQFHDLTLRQCSDVRCVLVHDEDESGAVRLDVILANVRGRGHPESVTKAATPSAHISNSSLHAEVWKLTFSRSSEAARLINHLSNV